MSRYQVRLPVIFTAATLMIISIVFTGLFLYLQRQYKRDYQSNLLNVIRIAVGVVDGDLLLQAQETNNTAIISDNLSQLQILQSADVDILSIQTFYTQGDSLISILDTDQSYPDNQKDFREYRPIQSQELEYFQLLNSPEVRLDVLRGESGPIISGYGPIFTSSGERIGTLKIVYSYLSVQRFERNLILILLSFGILFTVLSGFAGRLVGDRYHQNLTLIKEDIRQLFSGEIISTNFENGMDDVLTARKALYDLWQHIEKEKKASLSSVGSQVASLEERSHITEKALTTSLEINGKVGSPNLSNDIVTIIRDKFQFYYVGLYLVDETNMWITFKAGTGRAGQIQASKAGKIKFQDSEVGPIVLHQKPKIETSSKEDGLALATPELPLTRAQLMLPLVVNNQSIGAVVFQSEDPDKFTTVLVEVLQYVTEQVAVTIENSKLLAISQSEHEVLKNSLQQLTTHEWGKFLQEQKFIGFEANAHGVFPVLRESLPSPTHQINLIDDIQVQEELLEVPIKVRGRVLGVLSARKPQKTGKKNIWTNDEIRLMQELVDRMTTALDNARLYSAAQQSAERERIVSDITAKVRSSTDVQTIFQTAVQELASALALPPEAIQITKPDENVNNKHEEN